MREETTFDSGFILYLNLFLACNSLWIGLVQYWTITTNGHEYIEGLRRSGGHFPATKTNSLSKNLASNLGDCYNNT